MIVVCCCVLMMILDTTLQQTLQSLMKKEDELKDERLAREVLAAKEQKFEQQKAYLESLAKIAAKDLLSAQKETGDERRKSQRIATSLHQSEVALKKIAEEKRAAEEALRMLTTKVEHIRNEYDYESIVTAYHPPQRASILTPSVSCVVACTCVD